MIFAIGDIHGKLKMLNVALEHLQRDLQSDDTVVFLGDYIDRGEDSAGVIARLIRFKKHHKQTVFLRGNHEDMLLQSHSIDPDNWEDHWLSQGGAQTLKSFKIEWSPYWRNQIPRSVMRFIWNTRMEYVTERFHFVHAGLLPNGQDPEVPEGLDPRLWVRQAFIENQDDTGRVVVFGHTPQADHKPLVHRNKVGLDTGAFLPGGRLSVAGFDDSRIKISFPEFSLLQVLEDGRVEIDMYLSQ
jgi:serine/threonine protein phosphatase 1